MHIFVRVSYTFSSYTYLFAYTTHICPYHTCTYIYSCIIHIFNRASYTFSSYRTHTCTFLIHTHIYCVSYLSLYYNIIHSFCIDILMFWGTVSRSILGNARKPAQHYTKKWFKKCLQTKKRFAKTRSQVCRCLCN